MLDITWRCCLCIFVLVFLTGHSDIRADATHGGLPDGSTSQAGLHTSQEAVKLLSRQAALAKTIQTLDYESRNEDRGGISRRKRDVLFPSGVKLCTQETAEQAIANHLDYFHLRVCQETVWEAFKIFWDRLPERDEYQSWMTMCREGRVSTLNIGTNFSESPEHVSLVQSRMPISGLNSDPSNFWLHMCSPQTTAPPSEPDVGTTQKEEMISVLWPETFTLGLSPEVTPAGSLEVVQEVNLGVVSEVTAQVTPEVTPQTTAAKTVTGQDAINRVEEDMITNEIEVENFSTRPLREQVVELSIQLKGESYSDALRESSNPYYQRLAQQFTEKIEDAFERLPGFKSVAVLEFRDSAVVVHYVVTLEADGGITKEIMDYINLQSNLVGDSYPAPDERPTMVYTIADFRNYITEALHKENFIGNSTLAVDPDSLQLENVETLVPAGASNPSKPADEDMDNALDAEKPQNLSGQDLDSNDIFNSGFSKDYFLFDPIHSYDPWIESQGVVPSQKDVIAVDESSTLPPPVFSDRTFDMNIESTPKSENVTPVPSNGNNGDIEEEARGDMAVKVTESSWIASPAEAPPSGQGGKFMVDLFDTGSGSGLSEGEVGPLLPMVTTAGPREPGPESEIILEEDAASELGVVLMKEKEEGERGVLKTSIEEGSLFQDNFDSTIQTEDRMESESEKREELLMDIDFHSHPDHTAIEVAPTQSTHTLEASGIHKDDQESEPTTVIMPATDYASPHDGTTFISEPPVTTGLELTDTDLASLAVSVNEPISELVTPDHLNMNLGSDPDINVVPAFTETPIYVDVEIFTEELVSFLEPSMEREKEGVQIFEVEEATTEAHSIEILEDDIAKDEILAVVVTMRGPVAPKTQSPTLSPEKESPFTRVSDIVPEDAPLPPSSIPHSPDGTPEVASSEGVEQRDQDRKPELEIWTYRPGSPDITDLDQSFNVFNFGRPGLSEGDSSSGSPTSVVQENDMASVAKPNNGSSPGQALMVFFSLRVTNMMFSEDLFNKSSPEYKALEQRFLELLVPYLQSNLSNFQNLEILNFRNGSIVVNSRMKFDKPVPHGVTNAVYLILEDFCNTAYQTMNLAIDKYSLDVESGEQADPCKFQACNEFSECTVNRWSGEAECVCNAGYFSMDGLPCQSVCDLRHDFCQNDGKCDIIPGQGAICRCRVGENWWYRGEHCEEYVSEPLVVGIAIASVAGFLLVAFGVIFFLARTLRDQYDKDEPEDPIRRGDSFPSLERATKYNPMYESDITTGYSHYYRRYPEMPCYSSASAEASTDFSSEEIRHIYENSELTREEIEDRIRIIELYAKDRQFADFVRLHQVNMETRRESSST